jgi:hypothetical protein
MSGNPDIGSDTRTMLVGAGGTSKTFTYQFTTPPNSRDNMNWAADSLTFKAGGQSSLISFQSTSTGNCCWGPAVANVTLSAAPEPATWATMLLGFGLIGATMRRRAAVAASIA